jgi:hypothetical protein
LGVLKLTVNAAKVSEFSARWTDYCASLAWIKKNPIHADRIGIQFPVVLAVAQAILLKVIAGTITE